jgi:hypothetical protein
VTSRIESWQTEVADFLDRQGAFRLAIVFGLIVTTAIVAVAASRKRTARA